MIDRTLLFDAWMTYLITNPVFTLIIGDPARQIPGLINTIL